MKTWLKMLRSGWRRANGFSTAKRKKSVKEILRVFKLPLKESALPLLGGLCLFLMASVADLVLPKMQQKVVDSAVAQSDLRTTLTYGAVVAVLMLLALLFRTLSDFQINRAENQLLLKVQTQVFSYLLGLPKSYFDHQEKDGIINRISNDIYGIRSVLSVVLLQMFGRVPALLVSVVLLILQNPLVAAGSLLPIPLFLWLSYEIGRRTRALAYLGAEERAGVYGVIAESVKGATLIKTDGKESGQVEKLSSHGEENCRIAMEQRAFGSLMHFLGVFFQYGSKLIVFALGFYQMYCGALSFGGVIAMAAYLNMVYGPIQGIAYGVLTLQEGLTALERVSEFYEVQPEDVSSGVQAKRLCGEVRFSDVSFSYGENRVLNGVNFTIAPGKIHYLIGKSGVGKSTLLSLILCLYRPSLGSIFFDGKEESYYALESLRRRIAFVAQETAFFSGTVFENLAGQSGANRETVIAAAKTARIDARIEQLDAGYDTVLETGAPNFSQGERQRLSLARALVRDADIYVVDEPTAALDPENRAEIMEVLSRLAQTKTVLVVTHQLEERTADSTVFRLENGRLFEEKQDEKRV